MIQEPYRFSSVKLVQHNIISRLKNQHDYVESEARGFILLGARDACTREKVSF